MSAGRLAANVARAGFVAAPLWLLLLAAGMWLRGGLRDRLAGGAPGALRDFVIWWAAFALPVFAIGALAYETALLVASRRAGTERRLTRMALAPLLALVVVAALGPRWLAGDPVWRGVGAWATFVGAFVAACALYITRLRRPLRP